MKTVKQKSSVQLSLFPCQGTSAKDNQNSCRPDSKVVNNYLKTREGLFRLITLFPNATIGDAVRMAHNMFQGRKEVAL